MINSNLYRKSETLTLRILSKTLPFKELFLEKPILTRNKKLLPKVFSGLPEVFRSQPRPYAVMFRTPAKNWLFLSQMPTQKPWANSTTLLLEVFSRWPWRHAPTERTFTPSWVMIWTRSWPNWKNGLLP